MSQEDNVVYLNSNAVRAAAGQEAYGRIRQHVVDRLSRALAAMLDKVDDAFFERADKAENNQIQSAYFMAMRQLRLERRRVEQEFRQALERPFADLGRARQRREQPATPVDEDSLTLLDNEALETSIAIDGMISKTRAREARRLLQLQRCLEQVFPRLPSDEDSNPFDPAQLVQAFVDATSDIDIELAPRLVLYKLFDLHVLGGVGGLYDESLQIFAQAGIRPPPMAARRSTSGAAGPVRTGRGAPTTAGAAQQPLLDGLRQLLGEHAVPGFAGLEPVAGSESTASLDALVGALSQMQTQSGAWRSAEVRETLGQYLAAAPGGTAQRIGSLEGAAIDIVGMLFDVILDDPRLPSRIKALLARLQIPVLKVALLDGSFFSHKQHPARRLINEMARASIGWVEPEQLDSDPLYSRIKLTVERILAEFEDDPQLFSDLLDDFLIFLEEEEERARLVEERTRQAAEGKAKIERAKARVSAEIQRRTRGYDLPEVVHKLLGDAWSKVLFLAYLKSGEEGSDWRQKLEVVDRLIASVQPQRSAEARRRQLLEIPQLLQDLREGLNAILFNPYEMNQLFKQLEAEHVRCLAASTEQQPVPTPPAPQAAAACEAPEPEPEPEPDPALLSQLQKVDELPLGTWLEFSQGDGPALRAKLSARLNDGQQLVFVNRVGFKMLERSREDVAKALRHGEAVILDDDQLFDRALEAVIANLRTARAGL